MTARTANGPVAEWVKLGAALIVLPAIAWGIAHVIAAEKRFTSLESDQKTQLTQADKLLLYQALNLKADSTDVPPRELVVQHLENIEKELTRLRVRMDRIEDQQLKILVYISKGEGP